MSRAVKETRPPPHRGQKGGSPKVAVAYLRVSKEEQHLGPEAQRAAISAYASARGITIISFHEDRVTSVTEVEDRSGLTAALLSIVEHGAGLLLVAKRDRLARDVLLASLIDREVARCGAKVEAADGAGNGDTPQDRFVRTLMDAFAELERALIRARTRSALAVKKARGERIGSLQYGFDLGDDGKTLVRNEAEQAIITKVKQLRAEGVPNRRIAIVLADEGKMSRNGRIFASMQLSRMCR